MFDRPTSGEVAVLVHIDLPQSDSADDTDEFRELAISAGARPCQFIRAKRQAPHPKLFVGEGKADEILEAVQHHSAELVIFNHRLTPGQERNLERHLKCRVIDRAGLILDIFAQRARSHEGKLQVELAQLQHLSTRLVRGWTHLERQKGGIGLRGPGETQLETDRRLIRVRVSNIRNRLEKVRKQRQQSRRRRQRATVPTVSVVGYTNAGKSTLCNALANSDIYAADQLFATLDPTLRRIDLPGFGPAILADTVGFIRHLPHSLVNAFHATLEETCDADLLLHVVDTSDPEQKEKRAAVNDVLKQIDAQHVPQLIVFNKVDQTSYEPHTHYDGHKKPTQVWLSAQKKQGLALLLEAIAERLGGTLLNYQVTLPPKQSKLRAQLYALGAVIEETVDDEGQWRLSLRMTKVDYDRLFH